jgi:hypothetical protein
MATGKDTVLSGILKMVQDAQGEKPPNAKTSRPDQRCICAGSYWYRVAHIYAQLIQ